MTDNNLTRWTICACADCGCPVIGRHDCDDADGQARGVVLNARGELVAELAALRLQKVGAA